MSEQPQLERSVLERKERDELAAIAEAVGLKPGTRVKKADLIDSILRATGVDVPAEEAAPAKPKRTRTPRRAAAAAADAPPAEGEGAVAVEAPAATNGNRSTNGGGEANAPATLALDLPPAD